MAPTLTEAQRLLLGIIASVESGVTTPEDAVEELAELKAKAVAAGLNFQTDYTLDDFENIRENYLSEYDYESEYDGSEFDEEESDEDEED